MKHPITSDDCEGGGKKLFHCVYCLDDFDEDSQEHYARHAIIVDPPKLEPPVS